MSIVIPVWRGSAITKRCLEALVRHTRGELEIILIDNDADAETRNVVDGFARSRDNVTIIHNSENLGYPVACNQGLERARGDFVVLMNNDVVVTPHWASRLLARFSPDAAVGVVGPRTNFTVGPQRVDGVSYTLGDLDTWAEDWHLKHAGMARFTHRLIGFLLVARREVIERIGGFDPLFGVGNFEDDDFSLRAQLAGYRLVIADDVFVHHEGSQSFGHDAKAYGHLLEVNRRLFAAKWGVALGTGGYDPIEVLRRGAQSGIDLRIPLAFGSLFSRDGDRLDVGAKADRVLLCVPDPSDVDAVWSRCFADYMSLAPSNGTVGLIVRIEPTDDAWLHHVVATMRRVAKRQGIDLDSRDDVIVEARRIASADRAALYRAATDFVVLPGVRRGALTREAASCGLRILEGESLSRVFASRLEGAGT